MKITALKEMEKSSPYFSKEDLANTLDTFLDEASNNIEVFTEKILSPNQYLKIVTLNTSKKELFINEYLLSSANVLDKIISEQVLPVSQKQSRKCAFCSNKK